MKALSLLKENKSTKDRAVNYATSVKRNIQRDMIDVLISSKESIEDQLFELTDFTLDTDLNRGLAKITRNEVQDRFTKIINLEYELKFVDLELTAKQESFDKYFGNS
jgi:hypothetical protein